MTISDKTRQLLLELNDGPDERVGFILPDGTIIEVQNISDEPEKSFDVRGEDLILYITEKQAIATWHTHPNTPSNLSVGDYQTFLAYPKQRHFISGSDGLSEFYVEDGDVLVA
jgi:proteasome lid subunit RPN8/RPN11